MSAVTTNPNYEAWLVPALQAIQRQYGYLKREAMVEKAAELSLLQGEPVPLHRLQEVASFFPHFVQTEPKKVTVSVCRDMACHMACQAAGYKNGAKDLIERLEKCATRLKDVEIHGMSCAGRCDRPPVVGMNLKSDEHGHYFLKRSPDELETIIEQFVQGGHPEGDKDEDPKYDFGVANFHINPYRTAPVEEGGTEMIPGMSAGAPVAREPFSGVLKVVAVRNAALDAAVRKLQNELGWAPIFADLFRDAVRERREPKDCPDKLVAEAVKQWYTNRDWAQGWICARSESPDKPHLCPMPLRQAGTQWTQEELAHCCTGNGLREDKAKNWHPGEACQIDHRLADWSKIILDQFTAAPLRGMGGGGALTSKKLTDMRDAIRRARARDDDSRGFIVVNGDESEPSTFKDREILLRAPHLVVEGVIIAGLLTDATQGFIYIRHEYPEQIAKVDAAIAEAERLGYCGVNAPALGGRTFIVRTFTSPGGYVCGEQSALIEAMSDRRSEPRNFPPLETNGLMNLPTVVSNVETYSWMPYICIEGAQAYGSLGVNTGKGRRLFSVAGDVNRPGVYEAPVGMTLRELIEGADFCQGMLGGRKLKAFAPSGPSGGFLPAVMRARVDKRKDPPEFPRAWVELAKRRGYAETPLEMSILDFELNLDLFRALSPTAQLGAGLTVYAEDHGRDMLDQSVNAVEFYRNESCGKCVPCRLGSQKLASLGRQLLDGKINAAAWQELDGVVKDLLFTMDQTSICGLGRSVHHPVNTVLNHFRKDFESHLAGGAAPAARTTSAEAGPPRIQTPPPNTSSPPIKFN